MGLQSRALNKLPIGVRLFPLDVTFCFLGIPSALFSLFGMTRARSLETILPPVMVTVWSITLLVGCVAWFAGTISTKRVGSDVVITRIAVMIFGLTLVSLASMVYAVSLLALSGLAAVSAAIPLVTFAVGTYIRRVDLLGRVNDSRDRAHES